MTDGNTDAINKHLAEIEANEERARLSWPRCEECGERTDPDYMNENDLCDDCNVPSLEEMARMKSLYDAEKRAGLLKTPDELDQELRDAGRGHLAEGGL